ncbi:MAG: redoxin family protein, partial [Patescibacteria group bacterium]|nr:redoxin family protein [Patescibacteria group bacterium]
WKSDVVHSVVELEDLGREIAEPLAQRGGKIIAVNAGDTAEKAAEAAKELPGNLLILLDPERAYFHKLATERLPRTYVLDAKGTVLWFDLEYSRTTRRDLEQTIDVALGETSPQ